MPKAYIVALSAISYRRYITRSASFPKTRQARFGDPEGRGTDIIEKSTCISKCFFLAGAQRFELWTRGFGDYKIQRVQIVFGNRYSYFLTEKTETAYPIWCTKGI